MPSIYDCDEKTIRALDDRELIKLDRRIHKVWKTDLANCANDHRLGKLLSTLTTVHAIVVDELDKRDIEHSEGGPALPKRQRKMMTDFGEYLRKVPINEMSAIVISEEDGKKILDGSMKTLKVPKSPEAAEAARIDRDDWRFVVVAGTKAIGTTGVWPVVDNPDNPEEVLIGIDFEPLTQPVDVTLSGDGMLRRPGSVQSQTEALEKVDRIAIIEDLSNEQIIDIDHELHDSAAIYFELGDTPEKIIAAHKIVMAEIGRREIEYDEPQDKLAEATAATQKCSFECFVPFVHHEEVEKAEGTQRLVYGVVYKPYEVDAQGDWADEATIEKAAHRWMLESQRNKLMHEENTDKVRPVESFIAPTDYKLGGQDIKKGSWVLVSKVLDDGIWAKIKSGEFGGYSLGGRANAREAAPPRV